MPQGKTNKLYRTFSKGLITEAGYLTYPENSSLDELNTVISRKGNRTRRLGFDWEDGSTGSNVSCSTALPQYEFVWKAANNDQTKNFLVSQSGLVVRFFDLSFKPIDAGFKSFNVNLSSYMMPGATTDDVLLYTASMDSGKGSLFITHQKCEPLMVEYNTDDTITVTKISVLVRDFIGLDDGLLNDQEPTTLTKEHHYNLMNQGWVGKSTTYSGSTTTTTTGTSTYDNSFRGISIFNAGTIQSSVDVSATSPIFTFFTAFARYPGNNKQWWVARAQADDPDATPPVVAGQFLPKVLDQLYSGNNRAPRGHFILDAFIKDRSTVSGIHDIPTDPTSDRPNAVSFYSGRVWYGCHSTLYYSQILDSKTKAGRCYQEADPTSEDISDLIASDGGSIPIPELGVVQRMIPQSDGLLVFGTNGVWFVSGGGNSGFSGTDVAVSKISPIGTKAPLSVVLTPESVFWWSPVGIQALTQTAGSFGPIPGKFGNTNIAEETIQSYYNQVTEKSRNYSKGIYDPRNNVITWLWQDDQTLGVWQYDQMLNFDVTLNAFYPWAVVNPGHTCLIGGVFLNVGDPIEYVDDSVSPVRPTQVTYTVVSTSSGTIRFGQTKDTRYVDWYTHNSSGIEFDSYIVTGYELFNDAMREKGITYLYIYFRQTEDVIGDDGEVQNKSSCNFQIRWDWSNSTASKRWTTEREAYRLRLRQFLDPDDTVLDTGFAVVVTKNKVRGNGKSIQFRFGTSEREKNFDLLGWSVAATGNTEP